MKNKSKPIVWQRVAAGVIMGRPSKVHLARRGVDSPLAECGTRVPAGYAKRVKLGPYQQGETCAKCFPMPRSLCVATTVQGKPCKNA